MLCAHKYFKGDYLVLYLISWSFSSLPLFPLRPPQTYCHLLALCCTDRFDLLSFSAIGWTISHLAVRQNQSCKFFDHKWPSEPNLQFRPLQQFSCFFLNQCQLLLNLAIRLWGLPSHVGWQVARTSFVSLRIHFRYSIDFQSIVGIYRDFHLLPSVPNLS